ncbi:MAG TPA: LLM class F420-dependent oxidoreductase [Dehalococcoidia bacterium]
MKVGVVFPQTEIGPDPAAVREYAMASEAAGYDHLIVYDHVVGADPNRPGGWSGPYTHQSQFHEPFVLFGYLAAITRRLELVTGILISPQRQTVLIAKQAAAVDVLAGGRLRLGLGVGWNAVEYEALGENFHNRGRRMEEQVDLLRKLWTQTVVTYNGKYHHVTAAGINPLPIQRPIPIWMGGMSEPVLKRIARLADGWFPQTRPDDEGRVVIERLRGYVQEAGREPSAVAIEGRLNAARSTPDQWVEAAAKWRELGATHVSFNTMGAGFTSPQQHIDAVRQFKEALSVARV